MTKGEIKKAILDDERCLDGIVNIICQSKLEQPEERFLDYEICRNPGRGYGLAYMYLDENTEKIDHQILAATVGARIPGARWAAVDKDNLMYWYKDEPRVSSRDDLSKWIGDLCKNHDGYAYNIHCPVDNWKNAKWRLE